MTDKTLEELLSELGQLRKQVAADEAARHVRRKRRAMSVWTKVMVIGVILIAGGAFAAFSLTQTGTTTTGAAPVIGSPTLSMGTVSACTPGPCNGILMTGSPSGVAVTAFNAVSIMASWTATGVGFTVTGVWLVPSGTTACGTSNAGILPAPGTGQPAVSLPSTPGLVTVVTGSAYNYCVYSSAIPGSTIITVVVTYSA